MKILLLNPKIDAEHNVSKYLQQKGCALLFPADQEEAWQMLLLHGVSLDLIVIHREGFDESQSEAGLKFLARIKADPQFADLPVILTTESWSDIQCAMHQSGPEGVNAYLHFPFQGEQLFEMVQKVLGDQLGNDSLALSIITNPTSNPATHRDPSELSIRLEPPTESSQSGTPEISLIKDSSLQLGLKPISDSQAAPSIDGILEIQTEPKSDLKLESKSDPKSDLSSDGPSSASELEISKIKPSAPFNDPDPVNDPDPEAAQEMPYLFNTVISKSTKVPVPTMDPALIFGEPLGSAVVPGGAAQEPDLETVKKYLLLREQDVAVLSHQLKVAQDQASLMEQSLREEKAKNAELLHIVGEQKQKIEDFHREKNAALESLQTEIQEFQFQIKVKTDKARLLENQSIETAEEMERLKERVRVDIRKIRVREKELENRLEIMKKDSEALINARESKIIELKRKLDLLEFNMDLLQDQYNREKENSVRLKELVGKAAQVVKVAGGLLGGSTHGLEENHIGIKNDEKLDREKSKSLERKIS